MKANLKNKETIGLKNPWSKVIAPNNYWTWKQIVNWCKQNVHPRDQKEWIDAARKAVKNDDSETLGVMIIGS